MITLTKINKWVLISKLFPFIGLAAIILILSIIAGERLWTVNSLRNIIATMIPWTIGAMGMLFVASQGSTDLSMGSLLAFSVTIGGVAGMAWGAWVFVPLALLIGLCVGVFNGVMLAHFKVPSLMVTLAMLIALRGFVLFVNARQSLKLAPSILALNNTQIKYPVFIILLLVMGYLFEYTKVGFFSRCIGENQIVGEFAGIPVKRYKIFAFALSGLMAAFVGIFQVGHVGGVVSTMGGFFELQVMMAMFVGGIPVTGGAASKFYKIIVGSLMLAFLQNGLVIARVARIAPEIPEFIQGIILLVVIFLGLYINRKFVGRQVAAADTTAQKTK